MAIAGLASTATSWFHYLTVIGVAIGAYAPHRDRTWFYLPALWIAVDAHIFAGRGGTAVGAVLLTAALGLYVLDRPAASETGACLKHIFVTGKNTSPAFRSRATTFASSLTGDAART